MFKLYHNPRCSKSRAALAWLKQTQVDVTVYEYLQSGIELNGLQALLKKLCLSVHEVIRTADAKKLGLDITVSNAELELLICKHPILLERPILESDSIAAIGRPIENIQAIIEPFNSK